MPSRWPDAARARVHPPPQGRCHARPRSLQGVATGLLDDHLKHCVLDAAKLSDEAAHEKIQEATAAVNRLIRS